MNAPRLIFRDYNTGQMAKVDELRLWIIAAIKTLTLIEWSYGERKALGQLPGILPCCDKKALGNSRAQFLFNELSVQCLTLLSWIKKTGF